jgi:hypothetical protein
MSVRFGFIKGEYRNDVSDGGLALHDNYRAMAIANGVPADDPTIAACRS